MKRRPGADLGQATTEYLLMLLFAVSLFFMIFKGPIGTFLNQMVDNLNHRVTQMFTGENMYHFPFHR